MVARDAAIAKEKEKPTSAALQAAQFPCTEQFLGFAERQVLMPHRARYIGRARQREAIASFFDRE